MQMAMRARERENRALLRDAVAGDATQRRLNASAVDSFISSSKATSNGNAIRRLTRDAFAQVGESFAALVSRMERADRALARTIERRVRSGEAFSASAKAKVAGRRLSAGGHSKTESKTEDELDDAHWEAKVARDGRCSAYVRVTDGNGDLLVGHATWNDYSSMMRVFKYYDLPLGGEAMSGTMTRVVSG